MVISVQHKGDLKPRYIEGADDLTINTQGLVVIHYRDKPDEILEAKCRVQIYP